MRALVAYESVLGNTRQIAEDVGRGLVACGGSVTVRSVHDLSSEDLDQIDVLVVGAPVRMFNGKSRRLQRWLSELPEGAGRPAAVFETRVGWPWAGKMAHGLEHDVSTNGWSLVVPPISFRAQGTEGPLVWGEHGHAQAWGAEVATFAANATQDSHGDPNGMRPAPSRTHRPLA